MAQRYITIWHKAPNTLSDVTYEVSESLDAVEQVVKKIKSDGVWWYSTYPIGLAIEDLTSCPS